MNKEMNKKAFAGILSAVAIGNVAGSAGYALPVDANYRDDEDILIKAEYPIDFTVGGYYVEGGAKLSLNYLPSERVLNVQVLTPVEVDAKENEDINFGCVAWKSKTAKKGWLESFTAEMNTYPWETDYDKIYYLTVPNNSSIIEAQTFATFVLTDWNPGDVFALGDYEYTVDSDYHVYQHAGTNITAVKNNFEPTKITEYGPGFPIRRKPCISFTNSTLHTEEGDIDIRVSNEVTVFSNGYVRVRTYLSDWEYGGLDLGQEYTMTLGAIKTNSGCADAYAEGDGVMMTSTNISYGDDESIQVTGTVNGEIWNGELLCEVNFALEYPLEYVGDSVTMNVYGSTMLITKTDGSLRYKVRDIQMNDFDDPVFMEEEQITTADVDIAPKANGMMSLLSNLLPTVTADAMEVEDDDPLLHRVIADFYPAEEDIVPAAEEPETPPMPTEAESAAEDTRDVWYLNSDTSEEEVSTPPMPTDTGVYDPFDEENLLDNPPAPDVSTGDDDNEEVLDWHPEMEAWEDEDAQLAPSDAVEFLKTLKNLLDKVA